MIKKKPSGVNFISPESFAPFFFYYKELSEMRMDKRAIDEAQENKGGRVLREWRMWGGGGGEGSVGWKCGRKRRRRGVGRDPRAPDWQTSSRITPYM